MYILGIESSCDETAAAVVDQRGNVLSNIIATQIPVHARYGGVVPELASRNHAEGSCQSSTRHSDVLRLPWTIFPQSA